MPGMDIHEAARRVGALAWTERRLFEVVGGWVSTTPEPEPKLLFARLSRHHGDHALALAAVLPETRDHDASQLVTPSGDDMTERLDAAETTSVRRAALVDVATQQVAALDLLLADAAPVRDGPVLRVARLVRDEDAAGVEAATALG